MLKYLVIFGCLLVIAHCDPIPPATIGWAKPAVAWAQPAAAWAPAATWGKSWGGWAPAATWGNSWGGWAQPALATNIVKAPALGLAAPLGLGLKTLG